MTHYNFPLKFASANVTEFLIRSHCESDAPTAVGLILVRQWKTGPNFEGKTSKEAEESTAVILFPTPL